MTLPLRPPRPALRARLSPLSSHFVVAMTRLAPRRARVFKPTLAAAASARPSTFASLHSLQ